MYSVQVMMCCHQISAIIEILQEQFEVRKIAILFTSVSWQVNQLNACLLINNWGCCDGSADNQNNCALFDKGMEFGTLIAKGFPKNGYWVLVNFHFLTLFAL